MTDPAVEYPHEDEPADVYAPRIYHRDGTPGTVEEFEQLWADHGVAYSAVRTKAGARAVVSTIFLGLDHGIAADADGGPILYETAVYEPGGLVFRTRSRTEGEARTAHASALIDLVAAIENSTPDDPFPTAPSSIYVGLDEDAPDPHSGA